MNNVFQRASIATTVMGGLVAEAAPSDIPEGASPLTWDTDYEIGSVHTRDGLSSVYSFLNSQSAGPNGGNIALPIVTGEDVWTTPNNILIDDGSYASVVNNTLQPVVQQVPPNEINVGSPTQIDWSNPTFASAVGTVNFATATVPTNGFSKFLQTDGSTFSLPLDGVIAGIEVDFASKYAPTQAGSNGSVAKRPTTENGSGFWSNTTCITGTSCRANHLGAFANPTAAMIGTGFGLGVPGGATILGVIVQVNGSSQSSTHSNFPSVRLYNSGAIGTAKTSGAAMVPGGTAYLFGTQTDLWGATLTPAIVNSPNFGFQVQVTGGNTGVLGLIGLNNYIVTVYYSVPAPTPTVTLTAQLTAAGNPIGTAKSLTVSTGLTSTTFGNTSDLWGATLSPAMVNAGFGVQFQVRSQDAGTISSLNSVVLKVNYFTTTSDPLKVFNFAFNLSSASSITGIQVGVKGLAPNGGTTSVRLLKSNAAVGIAKTFTLPTSNTNTLLGSANDQWGTSWNFADLNNATFGIQLQVNGGTTSNFDYVTIQVFYTQELENFNFIKTYKPTGSEPQTLALDAAGTLWRELVNSAPNVLSSVVANVMPGSFCKSTTQFEREWMCFSDLEVGSDVPRQYNGSTNFDRISQVGPGAPPSVTYSQTSYPIVASPTGITQPAAKSDPAASGHLYYLLWSAGPTSRTAGNVLTVFYSKTTKDTALTTGATVYLNVSGTIGGQSVTGTYVITGLGFSTPGGDNAYYFTVIMPSINNGNSGGLDSATGTYQLTLATVTTTIPVPNVGVGSQVSLTGVGVTAWNSSWTILNTLNSGQYTVTQTKLISNIATYVFNLVTGTNPTVGSQVTVSGCVNGPTIGGTSIFNVNNATITNVVGNTFSISLAGANVSAAPESANAISNGTKFQFDPGLNTLGSVTNPIFGNSGGGQMSTVGNLSSGVRQAVVLFKTRNSYITAPSVPIIFSTPAGANSLMLNNIPIGPPNVVARIIAFTGANGGNFFYIPQSVTITGTGQPITYTSTVVNDNSSTSATFTFTDAVLLASNSIDVQGNNLFNQIELGSSVWNISYAGRMFYGLENNKLQNLINFSFDGGFLPDPNGGAVYPLGWSVDPVDGFGGQLNISPIFGNSYEILNTTGSTVPFMGVISQPAFQDYYKVPIISINTLYSVRITARTPSGSTNGELLVDLYSPSLNKIFGAAIVPCSSMTTNFQIFTLPLLTTAFTQSVPTDLLYRVYAANMPNNASVEVDRTEPFPTQQPVLSTEVQASYVINPEAFDGVTGAVGLSNENNEPVNGAFVQYDLLYFLKSDSMYSTQSTPGSEPGGARGGWSVHEVSNKIGTAGALSYDIGEEWMITACRAGLYLFSGGEPVKLSQEIAPIWDLINWDFGHTIWVRNDIVNRRILIGVPLPTPNQWLPNDAVNATPTTPNVVLMMNYKELNTSSELASKNPLHVSFSGKLISFDMSRKWSIWHITSPYADFIRRKDGTHPLFLCNGSANSKIYQLLSSVKSDDGVAINGLYTTYGFIKPEQEQQLGPLVGNHRKLYNYLNLTMPGGNGLLSVRALPNIVNPTYPYTVPGGVRLPVTAPNDPDVERPLNVTANRCFVQFSTNRAGDWFQLSKVIVTVVADPWAPLRGM